MYNAGDDVNQIEVAPSEIEQELEANQNHLSKKQSKSGGERVRFLNIQPTSNLSTRPLIDMVGGA